MKNSEELVQFVQIKKVKRFIDQILKHHFRQQSKRHELRSTIQNNDAEYSRNDIHISINDNFFILYFHLNLDAKFKQYREHYAHIHEIVSNESNFV